MLGKLSLIITSQETPYIVETKYIFKYEKKRKIAITEEDKENERLSVECGSLRDHPIRLIASDDAKERLIKTYQPMLAKRIKVCKRMSLTPKPQRKKLINKKDKKTTAQKKKLAEQQKKSAQKAQRYYADLQDEEVSGNESEIPENESDSPPHMPDAPGMPFANADSPIASPTHSRNSSRSSTPIIPHGTIPVMRENMILQTLTDLQNHMVTIDERLDAMERQPANNNGNNIQRSGVNVDNRNNGNGHDSTNLVPDENLEIEIIHGHKMKYTECAMACNAPRMSTRARRVIQYVWPEFRRATLMLRPNRMRPGWTVAEENDIVLAIRICEKMQEYNYLDEHRENNPALNMRTWLSTVLRNERTLKKKADGERNPDSPQDREFE